VPRPCTSAACRAQALRTAGTKATVEREGTLAPARHDGVEALPAAVHGPRATSASLPSHRPEARHRALYRGGGERCCLSRATGWKPDRVQSPIRATASAGNRIERSRCRHENATSVVGSDAGCGEPPYEAKSRAKKGRRARRMREQNQPLSACAWRTSMHALPAVQPVVRSTRVLQLTSRTFTKPRSRATPGGGVSTPSEICYLHDLRGKRATARAA